MKLPQPTFDDEKTSAPGHQVQDVTKAAFFAVTDPKLITINLAELETTAKKMREARDAANPPVSEPPKEELARLKNDLFNLTQHAKHTEVYANNCAGNVRLLEQRITDVINKKKLAVDAGNSLAERNHEHSIKQLEAEKVAAEKEFNRARRNAATSAAQLKDWGGHARVKELEKVCA